MLTDMIEKGYGEDKGYNCAQKIIFGANHQYDLGLDEKMLLPITKGLGGGLKTGHNCGALIGSVMVLGALFPEGEIQKEAISKFMDTYEKEMGGIDCCFLKEKYRTQEKGCGDVIKKAAQVLQDTIEAYGL